MTEKKKEAAGRADPLWNSVASFGMDDLFVLPEWIGELRGSGGVEVASSGSGNVADELKALETRVGDCRGCGLCRERNSRIFSSGAAIRRLDAVLSRFMSAAYMRAFLRSSSMKLL